MAGILESLGQGLRGAGAVLSEDVYKSQKQEELIASRLQDQQRTLMAQQVIKGAESGAIPPEVAKQTLSKLFPGMEVPLGPDAATQERQRTTQQAQAYQGALEQLGPDAPMEAQARLAARFGKPEVAAQFYNAVENRKLREVQVTAEINRARETLQQRADQFKEKLAHDVQMAQQRGADQKEIAQIVQDGRKAITQMMIDGRKEIVGMMGSLRQPPAPVVTDIVDPNNPGRAIKIDVRTNRVIGVAPPKAGADKPLTEAQSKNAMFGSRAARAHDILLGGAEGEASLEERISTTGLATKQGLESYPVIGGVLGAAGNVLLSPDQQRVEQAQRDFVNAVLRQESGATIQEAEFNNAKRQYFPQPGDSKAVIDQKRRNRETAIAGFKVGAGPTGSAHIQGSRDNPKAAPSVRAQADEILKGN